MKNLLPLFLLLITLHDAMAVTVCSVDHPVSAGSTDCNADSGCRAVYDTNENFFRCIPDCDSLNSQSACENYAGCEWNIVGGECLFFDGTTVTPAQYETRIGDGANATIQTRVCPNDYPNITNIADSEEFCYKPCAAGSDTTTTCGFSNDIYGQGDAVSCLDASSQILVRTDNYHAEGDSCYLNTRPCNLFPLSVQGITSPVATNVTGDAIWDVENQQYNTNACRYSATTLNSELHCNQSIDYPGTATTNSATTQINYNSVSGSSYYCASCENDTYYPTTAKPNTYHGCSNPNQNSYTACSCIKIEKGFYNSCSGGWNSNIQLSQCRTPCPVGQTTSDVGSTTISACQYGTDTKICDSTDNCVSLPAGNWTAIQ